jgi:HEAT repeat protein
MFSFRNPEKLSPDPRGQKYLDYLKERFGKIRLYGKDGQGEEIVRELEQVFVRLHVVEKYERPMSHLAFRRMMDESLRRRRNFYATEKGEEDESISTGDIATGRQTIEPDELLLHGTHAVVTGAPQCGKTTILRYLVNQVCQDDHDRLPVFLELKTIKAADFEAAGRSLVELVFRKAIDESFHLNEKERVTLRDLFDERLRTGKALILLDGLDEVREESFFFDLCLSIEQFINSDLRANGIIVTARPFVLQQVRIEGARELEISPLSNAQIKEFLRHYFGERDEAAVKLEQLLRLQPSLRELARVPFLLGVMVDLVRREHEIGATRLNLYKGVTRQLSSQLDKDKKIRRFAFQVVDPDGTIKLAFLRRLAFDTLLVDEPAPRIGGMGGSDDESGRLIFDDRVLQEKAKVFVERERLPNVNYIELANDVKASAMLREVGDDVYAFAHLVLHEYLAAEYLAVHPNAEKIFARAYFNPTLVEMEVLPMTLGLSPRPVAFYETLEALPESLLMTNFRLRVRGLNYIDDINHEKFKTLLDRIAQLLHPPAQEEGFRVPVLKSLRFLAEPARQYLEDKMIPLLSDWSSITKSKAAEALAIVGSEKSVLPLMKTLNPDAAKSNFFNSPTIGYSRHDEDTVHSVARALIRLDPEKAAKILATVQTSYSGGPIDRMLREIGTEEAHKTLLARRKRASFYDWRVSGYHTELMRECEQRSVKEVLLDALKHPSPDVRGMAIETIQYIGAKEFAKPVKAHLFDADYSVRWKAANALSDIGSEDSVEPLLSVLQRKDLGDVRWCAAMALGQIRSTKAVAGLIDVLNDSDSQVKKQAISALGWIGDKRAAAWIVQILERADSEARESAAFALGHMADETLLDPLLRFLQDADARVRTGCAYALGKIRSEIAVETLIAALSGDPSAEVRAGAAYSLGLQKTEKAVPFLTNAVRTDSDRRVRDYALESLGEIGTASAVELLVVVSPSIFLSDTAAAALAKINVKSLAEALPALLAHPANHVRIKAAETIGYYCDEPEILSALSTLSESDPEEKIRQKANVAAEKYRCKMDLFDNLVPISNSGDLSDNESKDGVLIAEVMRTVYAAGHIFRPVQNNDHGIDGEIEFKNEQGEATGKRVYLQLKSGDSHLHVRKSDDKEFFQVKKPRHLHYWANQGSPVLLVIRGSNGLIRWINVSDYIEQNGTDITQIEFDGNLFTEAAIKQIWNKT